MHTEVREGAELLAEIMRADPDYRTFLELSEKLEQDPALAERVHAFRKRNYELQNSSQDPEQEMWNLNAEYLELLREPLVSAYFEAEAGVCRMLQEIQRVITSEIQFPEL
ncbi:MAG: YlbF family regulator [Lachnospiraceae bacterium]|nr:YlbF family regulator [Lachnospiraceae bacterium]